jgi:hypothetical protein
MAEDEAIHFLLSIRSELCIEFVKILEKRLVLSLIFIRSHTFPQRLAAV